MFDCEYWSLEQAKLGKGIAPIFQGNVIVITGGAGTIGLATAKEFSSWELTFCDDQDPKL